MRDSAEKPKAAPAIDVTNPHQVANYIVETLDREEKAAASLAAKTQEPLAEDILEAKEQEETSADMLGDDEEDFAEDPQEESEEEAGEEEATHLVKVDGEEIEVPLSELIKGYSRQADYTRKTSALAQARKDLESRTKQLVGLAVETNKNLVQFDPLLARIYDIQWDKLAIENPQQYERLKTEMNNRLGRIQELQTQHADRMAHENEIAKDHAKDRFMEIFPEYKDEAKLHALERDLTPLLEELQYSPEEMDNIVDHRFFLLAREALEGRKLRKAMRNMNEKKVGPKPARIQKPGTGSEQRSQSKAIQTLKRKAKASGRMADLLRLVDATN